MCRFGSEVKLEGISQSDLEVRLKRFFGETTIRICRENNGATLGKILKCIFGGVLIGLFGGVSEGNIGKKYQINSWISF